MTTRQTFITPSKFTPCVFLALILVATAWAVSGQQVKRFSKSDAPRIRRTVPAAGRPEPPKRGQSNMLLPEIRVVTDHLTGFTRFKGCC